MPLSSEDDVLVTLPSHWVPRAPPTDDSHAATPAGGQKRFYGKKYKKQFAKQFRSI
jgi:hypothetical protein